MLKSLLGFRWKLVVSYVVVTLATVLVLEGLVILGAHWLGARGFNRCLIGAFLFFADASRPVRLPRAIQ